jgi:hypothetical protein
MSSTIGKLGTLRIYGVLTHYDVTGLRACHSHCPHCAPRTARECGNSGGFSHSRVRARELTFWVKFPPLGAGFPLFSRPASLTGPGRHEPSGTFVGGPRGIVWIARVLVKLLANLAASVGQFKPPEAAPIDYELDQMAEPTLHCRLKWCEEWVKAVKPSNEVLSATADECWHPAESSEPGNRGQNTNSEVSLDDDDEDEDVDEGGKLDRPGKGRSKQPAKSTKS